MLTRIGHAVFAPNRRVLVTSDIHGHADDLRVLLQEANYAPGQDVLIICGDVLEKGRQNLKALRMVMQLAEQGEVYFLIGNTDMTLYRLLTQEGDELQRTIKSMNGGKAYWGWTAWDEVCAELGLEYTPEMDFDTAIRRARSHLTSELDFLSRALTILETPEYIFVHAALPHERLDELEGTDNWPLLKRDNFFGDAPAFTRWVTVGHWPVQLNRTTVQSAEPMVDEQRRLICIDGGCGVKRTGQLNMMILENGQRRFLFYDDHPRVRALADQMPSSHEPVYIKWTTRFIESSEQQGDVCRIVYHGRELTVPASFVSSNP